ncbi:MAG: protein kinase [Myxococcota bacterium]
MLDEPLQPRFRGGERQIERQIERPVRSGARQSIATAAGDRLPRWRTIAGGVELAPGTRLDRYEVLELLATGGMGEVYVARATGPESFQKLVALKRILPHLEQEEEFVAMFLEEARLAATLDHPNIVQVIELGQSRHGYFLTMELVHGVDLRTLLRHAAKTEPIPLACALSIAAALAGGLHYAHERIGPDGCPLGLVHRDVSPSNVLITYDGVVKLVDFGVAKAAAHTTRTRATVLKGKVGYMSPEQCRGVPVDRRTDLFSLGVLLYELTTLHRPFYEDNHFAALNRIVSGDYERPTALVPDYPPGLEQIVSQALAADPSARYPTARAMLDDLEQFAQAEGLRISSAVLADYVVEQLGRPPFPTYGPVSAPPPTPADVQTAVAPLPVLAAPSSADSRGQMWLGLGLVATALMSTATLVITLMRDNSNSAKPVTSPSSPTAPKQAGEGLAPSRVDSPVGEPTPRVAPGGSGGAVDPVGASEAGTGSGERESRTDPGARHRNGRKRRGRRGSTSSDKPSKPSFESIFPP